MGGKREKGKILGMFCAGVGIPPPPLPPPSTNSYPSGLSLLEPTSYPSGIVFLSTMGRETTENELLAELQPLYAKSAPKAPPVGRAKAAPEAPLAEGQSRGPLPMAEMIARLKAPPANAPATISAR